MMDLNPPFNLLVGGGGGAVTTGRTAWSTTVKPMRLSFLADPAFLPGTGLLRAPAEVKEATCLMTGAIGSASDARESEAKESRSSSGSTLKPRAEDGPISTSGGVKRDVLADSDVARFRVGGGSGLRSSKDVEPLDKVGLVTGAKDLALPAPSTAKKPPFLLCNPSAVDGRRGSFDGRVREGAGFPKLDWRATPWRWKSSAVCGGAIRVGEVGASAWHSVSDSLSFSFFCSAKLSPYAASLALSGVASPGSEPPLVKVWLLAKARTSCLFLSTNASASAWEDISLRSMSRGDCARRWIRVVEPLKWRDFDDSFA